MPYSRQDLSGSLPRLYLCRSCYPIPLCTCQKTYERSARMWDVEAPSVRRDVLSLSRFFFFFN